MTRAIEVWFLMARGDALRNPKCSGLGRLRVRVRNRLAVASRWMKLCSIRADTDLTLLVFGSGVINWQASTNGETPNMRGRRVACVPMLFAVHAVT